MVRLGGVRKAHFYRKSPLFDRLLWFDARLETDQFPALTGVHFSLRCFVHRTSSLMT